MANPASKPKLFFLTSGKTTPSSRYRVFQFVPRLQADGFSCRVANSFPEKYEYIRWLGWRPSRLLKRTVRRWHLRQLQWSQPDIVVLERELFDEPTWEFEEVLRRRCRRLVLDIDDAVFLRYPEKMAYLAGICDAVIVGNSRLEEWFLPRAKQVIQIPTCVDIDHYLPAERPAVAKIPRIGWIGTPSNLKELSVVLPALKALHATQQFQLRIISTRRQELDRLELGSIPIEWVEWSPETATSYLGECDLGIMPLEDDNPWNEYKCGLKLIEYMAVGLPVVASAVGVNSEIVSDGENGLLANSESEWISALQRLLADTELCRKMGRLARKTVCERYSVQAWLPKLEQALIEFAR